MKPVEFEGMNKVLTKPDNMTEEECGPLPAFTKSGFIVSCWEVTTDELIEISKTRRITDGLLKFFAGLSNPQLLRVRHFRPLLATPPLRSY